MTSRNSLILVKIALWSYTTKNNYCKKHGIFILTSLSAPLDSLRASTNGSLSTGLNLNDLGLLLLHLGLRLLDVAF